MIRLSSPVPPAGAATRWAGLALGPALLLVLGLVFLAHVAVGAKSIPPATVIEALTAPDRDNFDHVVIRDLRLPRAIHAVVVGAALAVAGALMQGVTRNPLAEPGLLGLMEGAALAVVLWILWQGPGGAAGLPVVAAAGALGGAALVWALASAVPGGAQPLSLILSGARSRPFWRPLSRWRICLTTRDSSRCGSGSTGRWRGAPRRSSCGGCPGSRGGCCWPLRSGGR